MRFRYSTSDPAQDEFDSLPRVLLILRSGALSAESVGLVDSGATVSVLPYEIGLRLGMTWEESKAVIRLSGSLEANPPCRYLCLRQLGICHRYALSLRGHGETTYRSS